jgi:hypothetical protein
MRSIHGLGRSCWAYRVAARTVEDVLQVFFPALTVHILGIASREIALESTTIERFLADLRELGERIRQGSGRVGVEAFGAGVQCGGRGDGGAEAGGQGGLVGRAVLSL